MMIYRCLVTLEDNREMQEYAKRWLNLEKGDYIERFYNDKYGDLKRDVKKLLDALVEMEKENSEELIIPTLEYGVQWIYDEYRKNIIWYRAEENRK